MLKTIAAANELLSDPEKRARFNRGEIDEAGQERAQRPSYRDHAEGVGGRHYSHAGYQDGGFESGDFSDIFGSMFGDRHRDGGHFPTDGNDERYSLATNFLDAVNGATRRLTLPDGRVLDVKIPPGTVDRALMRLRGQGGRGANGGDQGDALIEIHIASHPWFQRHGQDIKMTLPVSLPEAVLGGAVDVATPRGTVKMQVPPGSDSGTELRLRGRGVAQTKDHAAGDLYVKLRVIIGKSDAALSDFMRSWNPSDPINPRAKMEAVR